MLNEYKYNFIFNPFIKYKIGMLSNLVGTNEIRRATPIIVSISASDNNFDNMELTLYSLLCQIIRPDRIILWVSDKYDISDLPYEITRFVKNGLEIKRVKDLQAYTKTIYPLQQYPNAIVVTASENVYYPKDWLMKLYHSYIASPNDIHVHVAHEIKLDFNKKSILTFTDWEKNITKETSEYTNFISETGGVLYPPNCFSSEAFRDDVFLKNNIFDPSIWFWFMGVISGHKVRVVKNHMKTIHSTDIINLLKVNQKKRNKKTDEQIKTLMEFYRQNILTKLN